VSDGENNARWPACGTGRAGSLREACAPDQAAGADGAGASPARDAAQAAARARKGRVNRRGETHHRDADGFRDRDHYAGSLKGVVLTLCPDAAIVDISHDIPPHDILTGALELAACYRFFPAGTIFLAVVDPGVGSARLGIAAKPATTASWRPTTAC